MGWRRAAAVWGTSGLLLLLGCSENGRTSAGHDAGAGPPTPDARVTGDAESVLDARPPPDAPTAPPPDGAPPDAPSSPALRVLFIGNSYTAANDLPSVVRELGAATPGAGVQVEAIAPGGALLVNHWSTPETRARVESGEFGVVVLQGQSVEPMTESETFNHYVSKFSGAVRGAGARPVWFATWARREGDALYTEFPGFFRDPAFMTSELDFRYVSAAGQTKDVVARVGAAWEIARTELPEIALYAEDGSHPSPEGTLLAACVLFPWITGRPAQLPQPPPLGVSMEVAERLCALEPRVRCPEKKTFCGGGCVDVRWDVSHCDDCDEPCNENDPCRDGVCGCGPELTGCSRSCVNLQTDPRYCGDCSTKCAPGEACVGGKCACPAAHLMQPTVAELTALHPECVSHNYLGILPCAAAAHALCRQLDCFTSGFGPASGHSANRDGSVVCVPGDVKQTTYTALKGFEAACDGAGEALDPDCVTAIHRYCVSVGAVSGYGPVARDGDAVTVTCLTKATVLTAPFEAVRTQASRCFADPVECTTASSSYCAEQGHLAGFGPVERSGDSATVICVDP